MLPLEKHLISAVDIIKGESGQAERQGRNESGTKEKWGEVSFAGFRFHST